MRYLLAFLPFLIACDNNNCEMLPRVAYDWVLVNQEEDSFYCWSQTIKLDLTTDESFANVFTDSCHVTLARSCDASTTLEIKCIGVDLTCQYEGSTGTCVNKVDNAVCHYVSKLLPSTGPGQVYDVHEGAGFKTRKNEAFLSLRDILR